MWVAEGLTHRYPTKVLAELLPTCPQYCGHCTRMDLVGNSTPVIDKLKFARQAGRPARRRCSTTCAVRRGARRRGLRRRRGQHAVAAARGVPDPAARDREHPRHPARHQGADGPAPALAAGRRARRHGAGRHASPATRGVSIAIHTHVNHANSVTPLVAKAAAGDARHRHPRRPQPGRAARRRQRRPARAARPVLRAARRRADHALLLLHVRHDPVLASTGGSRSPTPSGCSTTSWATCPASRRRASSATCRSSASAGCTSSPTTTASAASPTGRRTTAPRSRPTDPEALTRTYDYYDPIHTLPEAGQAWWAEHARPRRVRAQGRRGRRGLAADGGAAGH